MRRPVMQKEDFKNVLQITPIYRSCSLSHFCVVLIRSVYEMHGQRGLQDRHSK